MIVIDVAAEQFGRSVACVTHSRVCTPVDTDECKVARKVVVYVERGVLTSLTQTRTHAHIRKREGRERRGPLLIIDINVSGLDKYVRRSWSEFAGAFNEITIRGLPAGHANMLESSTLFASPSPAGVTARFRLQHHRRRRYRDCARIGY